MDIIKIFNQYGEDFARFYLQIRKEVHARSPAKAIEARLPELLAIYQEKKQHQQQNNRESVRITPPLSESGTNSGTESLLDDLSLKDDDLRELEVYARSIATAYEKFFYNQEHQQQPTFDYFVKQFESVAQIPTMINQNVFIGSSEPESRSSGLSINKNQPQLFGLQTVASTSTNVLSQAPSVASSFNTPYIADYPEYDRPGPSSGTLSSIQQSTQLTAQQNVLSADQDQVNKPLKMKDTKMKENKKRFSCTFNNECVQSAKNFDNLADIKRHWVAHFNVRPYTYKYDDCITGFNDRNTAVKHIKKMHLDIPVEEKLTKSQRAGIKKLQHVEQDKIEHLCSLYPH